MKVLIVDDQSILLIVVRQLQHLDPRVQLVGDTSDAQAAIRAIEKVNPNVVLINLTMPRGEGLRTALNIQKRFSNVVVIGLSILGGQLSLYTFHKGAVPQRVWDGTSYDELAPAVQRLLHIAAPVHAAPPVAPLALAQNSETESAYGKFSRLTRREVEVLRLVAQGMTSREIAGKLGISVYTVHRHRASIMRKLEVRNVAELMRYTLTSNLLKLLGE